MKIWQTVLIGLMVVLCGTSSQAAEVVKLGFFDMQSVIDLSEMGKAGAERFKLEKEQIRQSLEEKLKEITALDDEFKKKELLWSDDVKKVKAQEIMSLKMEYDRLTYQANRKLGEQEQELLRPIRDRVLAIVTRIGKEEGYTMIWEMGRSGLAYAPASLELTDRIVQELNETAAKEKAKQ